MGINVVIVVGGTAGASIAANAKRGDLNLKELS
jgi:hypothetical protein